MCLWARSVKGGKKRRSRCRGGALERREGEKEEARGGEKEGREEGTAEEWVEGEGGGGGGICVNKT